jgi:hypothetical protein
MVFLNWNTFGITDKLRQVDFIRRKVKCKLLSQYLYFGPW